jgi:hypothetical protein
MLGIDNGFVKRYGIIQGINALRNLDYSYIDLSGIKLGLLELNTLKHALQQCPHIYKVVLDSCEIDDEGCEALFDILTEVPTVLHLSLRNNKITDVGVNALCVGLRSNKTLLELFLSGNVLVTYISMIALGDVLMENPSLCTLGFLNIPRRQNCLFSSEPIANNFAMLFLLTGNKDEEELLGCIIHKRQKLFTKISDLLVRNDFENMKVYLKNNTNFLDQGGYNAIKYYLVLDEGEINLKLLPKEADEKISKLKAIVEEYERLKTPALIRQHVQIVEIEKKRGVQSQEPTLILPQNYINPKKKRRVPFEHWVSAQETAEAGQTNSM